MTRHWRLLRLLRRRRICPDCRRRSPEMFCDVCGYDLVRQTRDKALPPRVV
jgi:predicted amidophosphoribosyltransferase